MQQMPIDITETEFHAVEYMRQVRDKLSQQYLNDRQKYLEAARKAMEAFKTRVAEAQQ